MDEIQETLKHLESKGWTMAAVADELGTHRETVSRWKTGGQSAHNAKGVLLMLQALERRQRIPKGKRYATPRKRADGTGSAGAGAEGAGG